MIIAKALPNFKAYFRKCFKMKDLGALKYLRGLEIAKGPTGKFDESTQMCLDIIYEASMEQHHQLALADGLLFDGGDKYCRLMGG